MISFGDAQKIINREISSILIDREPEELYQPVNYILSTGGKRMRPSLVLMACSMFSDDISHAIRPAIAVEIFHNFTLLHDDIMDNSVLRRSKPTVHEKWNRNVAILSGDAMSILSYKFIADSPSSVLPQVLDLFTETALKICEGQQFDLNYETRKDISVVDYLKMIELKTAALIAASLKLGAILGGAAPEEADDLYEFGRNLGIAFQLRDDVLDVYGDTEKIGKKTGMDILANKKTYLMLKAIELADKSTRKHLDELISSAKLKPEDKINQVIKIFDTLGIRQITETMSYNYYHKVLEMINQMGIDKSCHNTLMELAKYFMEREY